MDKQELYETYGHVLHTPESELSHPERAIRALLLEHTQIEVMVSALAPDAPAGATLPQRVAFALTGVAHAPAVSPSA